jgi:hypothetical protein
MTALVGASDRDVLQQLIDDLDRDRDFDSPPVIATLYASGERDIDRLDGADTAPVDLLLGWRAPRDCTAVAAAVTAWAVDRDAVRGGYPDRGWERHPDNASERCPDGERLIAVMAFSRGGLELGRLRCECGHSDEQVPEGVGPDCLRRAVGRPTRPPASGTGPLFSALWLDQVLDLASRTRSPLTWARVARAHPAMQLFEQCGERLPVPSFVGVAQAMANVLDWGQVRYEIVERAWLNAVCRPEVAEWMDDGMLSRWLLSAWPSVEELAAGVSEALDPPLARRVRAALRQLGTLRR